MKIIPCIASMNVERLEKCRDAINLDCGIIWANSTEVANHVESGSRWVVGREVALVDGKLHANNLGVTPAYQKIFNFAYFNGIFNFADFNGAEEDDYLLYLHDDTYILDPDWYSKCTSWLKERPNCGVFGFGGGRGIGDPDMYKTPYKLQQLARRDFISNMKDGEIHGRIVTEPTKVVVLDLFSLGVKMELLRKVNGWADYPHVHHNEDNYMCLQSLRHGYDNWMLPINVHHHGGLTSTQVNFEKDFGMSESKLHSDTHVTIYNEFRDVLPVWIEG